MLEYEEWGSELMEVLGWYDWRIFSIDMFEWYSLCWMMFSWLNDIQGRMMFRTEGSEPKDVPEWFSRLKNILGRIIFSTKGHSGMKLICLMIFQVDVWWYFRLICFDDILSVSVHEVSLHFGDCGNGFKAIPNFEWSVDEHPCHPKDTPDDNS